ncbi:hypothetical protein [Microbacterium saperdae]|uniref:Uncharacterized protein n=1 Tax=Microbacterium saperdae TaxID=69368 RepID=A0A543BMS2_9MICO|nr:hypothetical protein [Microbacterium saperdae]TQL86140.1 hypothetical protein FB560_1783 [Microbacterium saperdae]GGM50329.1 hypothetical protein GCM10010489_22230 [Microbacterium saperdae]
MARLAGVAAIVLVTAGVIYGCAWISPESQMERQLRSELADMVEGAQDATWQFREELAADPEAVISEVGGIADARAALSDPTLEVPFGVWTLIDLAKTDEGTALTLTTKTDVSRGGGFFTMSDEGRVCFDLLVSPDGSRIDTLPADCGDVGQALGDDLQGDSASIDVGLNELDLRRSVDSSDYRPLPCQCYSGSDCDCPGG